jgi:F-type H+-transporting ATPase subunit alpha
MRRLGLKTDIKSVASVNINLSKDKQITGYAPQGDFGEVESVLDGIVWITGLDSVMYGEVVILDKDLYGLVMSLDEKKVGALVLGRYDSLRPGDRVIGTGRLLNIGVSEDVLGRVIDPMGNPLDEKPRWTSEVYMPLEKIAPSIMERKPVNSPLQTGIKSIDAMVPIGRGQRELIVGDRGTGKTAIAVDTIINQKDTDVLCIYVAIGQRQSKIAEVINKLDEYNVLKKTVVVCASASDSAAYQYIAPYAGCAIGEYFMQKGKDVLIVYDDLTKHAWAYRELALLLKRPSGREAYPGDVFYLHSRLLERACQLSDDLGGGSLTALPIIETQAQDVSAYIPTNVISITDGQIYLESDLFFAGVRPALNVGLSVSRVGGAAQAKAMKKVAGRLRLDLSQYYELAAFTQFTSDVDDTTKARIERGKRIVEILKQGQYSPMSLDDEVLCIFLAVSGGLDDVPIEKVENFEREFLAFFHKNYDDVSRKILREGSLDEDMERRIMEAIGKFKSSKKGDADFI